MKSVALIGSNGFIGRHLVRRLKREKDVSLFLFGRSDLSFFKEELPYTRINFYDQESLKKNFEKIDLVYYLASETIPSTSWEDPLIEMEKNLKPFLFFLEAVSKLNIKKIAFVSSAGTIYGTTEGKVNESFDKRPFSPYGIVKLTMENFLRYYQTKYQIQFDIYRLSNVYGEGQDTSKGLGIINTFIEKIKTEKKVTVFGDGGSTRNYIYVQDAVEFLTLSLSSMDKSGTYNVSSGDTFSINQLLSILKSTVSEDFEIVYEPGRKSDNSFIDLDNSNLVSNFPQYKFTDIREGIRNTYIYIESQIKSKIG